MVILFVCLYATDLSVRLYIRLFMRLCACINESPVIPTLQSHLGCYDIIDFPFCSTFDGVFRFPKIEELKKKHLLRYESNV